MATYTSADIKCPFYMSDNPKTCHITCEGVPPGSSVKSHFPDKKTMQAHIGRRCAGDYKACPWYRLNWAKYEE